MKFDDQLSAYLYEYKSLQLEGIGIFTLDEKAKVPAEQEKEIYYPIEGLSFHYNPRQAIDENVVFFLVKKLGKIEPLVRSDLEYYLSNLKQLLNIGQPYTIKGIGTLNKNNDRIYEFTPGSFLPAKEGLYPERENLAHNYHKKSKWSRGSLPAVILIVFATIAIFIGIISGVLNFTGKKAESGENQLQPEEQAVVIAAKADTTIEKKDTQSVVTATTSPSAPADTSGIENAENFTTYKMVFEVTKSKERARSRTQQLNNLHSYTQYDSIPINDSIAYYRLFLLMKINPADSTRVRDSLQTLFKNKIFIEK